jgi:hypothetical protein
MTGAEIAANATAPSKNLRISRTPQVFKRGPNVTATAHELRGVLCLL